MVVRCGNVLDFKHLIPGIAVVAAILLFAWQLPVAEELPVKNIRMESFCQQCVVLSS